MLIGSASYYLAQRRESMRRARNCAYYAQQPGPAHVRASWQSSARHAIRTARLFNWCAVARLREYSRASQIARHIAPPRPFPCG